MSSPKVGARLGTKFGPYELQSLIGIGGMGEVYRAFDTVRERTVALKLLRTDVAADPSFEARFRRESRIAARLHAPNVIPVHDFGEIDGVLYIDMRLVEGPSVKELLRVEGALSAQRTVAIITQVAAALDAAHANGLVHRDIKPENVLLTRDDFAYLVDFGIAYGGGEASVTKTGLVIGSCAYMATERLGGQSGGPPSDVYSLTCLLFECLTGRAPFEAADLRQVMSGHMFSPPPRPTAVRQGINPAFDDVVARGMAKNPAERYASASDLARAADAAARGWHAPVAPTHPSAPLPTQQFAAAPVRTSKFSRGQKALLMSTIAMFALAGILALAVVFSGNDTSSTPPTRLAAPPPSTTTVTTTAPPSSSESSTSSSSATTTSSKPSTSSSALAGMADTDAQGFVNHAARCDDGSTVAAAIRTASSLAVICQTTSGSYYYHGERLSDGANLKLANAVETDGGFEAVNPADGAHYEVRPDRLTISSNGKVDSSEPPLEYGSD